VRVRRRNPRAHLPDHGPAAEIDGQQRGWRCAIVSTHNLIQSTRAGGVRRPASPHGAFMEQRSLDSVHYQFLTVPGAALTVRLSADDNGTRQLLVAGNRAGLLSLANCLLWLVANAWRRELLSLAELPFVHVDPPTFVCLRVTDADSIGQDGALITTDGKNQWEWSISEDDLRRAALTNDSSPRLHSGARVRSTVALRGERGRRGGPHDGRGHLVIVRHWRCGRNDAQVIRGTLSDF